MNAFALVLAVSTFCNPMPIPDTPVGILIRDTPNGQSYAGEAGWRRVFWSRGADLKPETTRQFRELADPAVYVENGRWYLYPSCGLMWTSDDGGGTWRHEKVVEKGEYAPAIAKFRGRYYLCTSGGPLSVADSPTGPFETLGKFDLASFGPKGEVPWTGDPALLADGDRLYLYWGCCNYPKAIWGVELDPDNPLRARTPGSAKCLMEFDTKRYPWLKELIEGAWAFKRGDTYYLCYSTANTAEVDYQWCCLKGKAPLGPFEPQAKNPFFVTERGLVTGTGHGSIWSTQPDEWWISSCVHVGAYHGFERLICMDRLFFEPNGDIAVGRATETPQWLAKSGRTGDTGWRKLALAGGPVEPTDDRFSTWWQAGTGDSGAPALPATLEYALDGPRELHAMRLIWRDVGMDTARGVLPGPFQYRVDVRERGAWRTWIDATSNATDLLVDYREGEVCVADGVRLVVLGAPKGIVPGVADFTVFGLPARPSASFADFDARAKAGERLTVVYFGGSLTWSANASEPNRTGFRGRMSDYLMRKYPEARFTFVDAAIGGTGSKLGIFRLERDVMAHRPDLVFIDFICNDGGECRNIESTCCYEHLLRSIVGAGVPVVQMFFTFKFWAQHGAPYDAPTCHPRLKDYRRLVAAYSTGVGDVYTDALIPAIDDGSIDPDRKAAIEKVWPIDMAHPGDFGYGLFAKAGEIGYERAVAAKLVCRVPEKPVFGTVKDVVRTDPVDGGLPAGWTRQLTYRTSAWYDGLSSRWMGDVAVFSGRNPTPLAVRRKGNFFAVFGEGDGDALGWDLAVDGANAAHFEMKFPAGRLMVFRGKALDGWEAGVSSEHTFAITPVPAAPTRPKARPELHVGSICTATIVPDAEMLAETRAADAAASAALKAKRAAANLEKLDHGRGKKGGEVE